MQYNTIYDSSLPVQPSVADAKKPDRLLEMSAVADLLGCSRANVTHLIRAGTLPAVYALKDQPRYLVQEAVARRLHIWRAGGNIGPVPPEGFTSLPGAARVMGWERRRLWKAITSGRLPATRSRTRGGRPLWWVALADLNTFMQAHLQCTS